MNSSLLREVTIPLAKSSYDIHPHTRLKIAIGFSEIYYEVEIEIKQNLNVRSKVYCVSLFNLKIRLPT